MAAIEIKKTVDDEYGIVCSGEPRPEFPWGTEIRLEEELVDKLGMFDQLETDQVVVIQAVAFVSKKSESSSSESGGEKRTEKCLSFQLTKIDVQPQAPQSMDRMNILYRG